MIHRRRGIRRAGGTFEAFKIRTMVQDADRILQNDESLRRQFQATNKLVIDPRITPVGRWLRRLSVYKARVLILCGDFLLPPG